MEVGDVGHGSWCHYVAIQQINKDEKWLVHGGSKWT